MAAVHITSQICRLDKTWADPGEGAQAIIFGPNQGPNGQKHFGGDRAPFLSQGLEDRAPAPSPYLKVWIHLYKTLPYYRKLMLHEIKVLEINAT